MRVTAPRVVSACVGAWTLAWSLGLSAQAGSPGQITAFVIAGEAGSERVYVAGTNRAIYEMPLPAGEGRVPLDGARRIYESPQFKHISGLAIRRDNVLLCDTALPAVFELEPRTQKLSLVLWGSPLKAPTDIATSDRGEIAIADPEAGGVVFIGTDDRPTLRRWANVHSPSRVRFDGRRFVIADQTARAAFDASIDKPEPDAHPLPLTIVSGDRGATDAPFIHSLSVAQGTRYFASNTEVLVLPQGGRQPFRWVPNVMAEQALPGPLLVRASDDRFVIAQLQAPALHVVRRVVPADFTFDMEPPLSTAAVVAMYRYLYDRHMLPTAMLTPAAAGVTLQQWLVSQQVLIGPLEPAKASAADLLKLLCELNVALCAGRATLALDRKVDAKVTLRVPTVEFTRYMSVDKVDLKGRQAGTFVNAQVGSFLNPAQIDSGAVWQMNSASRSLEAEFGRQRLTLATPPRADLTPGTVITYTGSAEQVITKEGCGIRTSSPASKPWFVPDGLQTADVRPYLPRTARDPALLPRQAELTYVHPTLEALPDDALAAAPAGTCSIPGNPYVITGAVKVSGIRARDAAGRGERGAASFDVDEPLYIAYYAVPLKDAGRADASPADPSAVKPNAAQNVFRKTTGELNLPAMRWRAAALVDIRDYRDRGSELGELHARFPGLRIFSTESLGLKQQSLDDQADLASLRSTLQAERRAVFQAIDYDDSLPVMNAVVNIGISEAPDSVSMTHPGFIDKDQKSAWWLINTAGRLYQFKGTAATDAPGLLPGTPPDHGTHVGGIIGARRTSLLPGLLPASQLVLVAPAQNAALHHAISSAVLQDVNVFNFSFSIARAAGQDDDLNRLKERMGSDFANALFVVAGGNSGKDLAKLGERDAPIAWVPETADNMIGVAAATSVDEERGRTWQVHSDSNYGKNWVQLAAPGDRVVSLSAPASFRRATGTSEAAPQVAATAAMLIAQRRDAPPRAIKARLLYTSTWAAKFEGKVWAGLLNVRRAVTNIEWNMVARLAAPQTYYGFQVTEDPHILIQSAQIDKLDASKPSEVAEITVGFRELLRIEYQPSERRWRVFYLVLEDNQWHMRIANRAILSGTLTCTSLRVVDSENKRDEKAAISDAVCGPGLDVSQISDYVATIDRLPRAPFSFY